MEVAHATLVAEVTEPSMVGEVRRTAQRLAERIGLAPSAVSDTAIVATELATNLVRYAHHGRVFLQGGSTSDPPMLEVLAVDDGPGIADLRASMRDGHSGGGGRGEGLGAVRRLAHAFDVHTSERGTVVMARLGVSRAAGRFSWAGLSTCAPHEEVCGDTWRVVTEGDRLAVCMADGLGHGPLAAVASQGAIEAFGAAPFDGPDEVTTRVHRALAGTRGAAVAVARLDAASLHFAGVGNIAGTYGLPGQYKGMASQNGTAGVNVRRAQAHSYGWPVGALLVLHSDGLTTRWSLDAYPGLAARHPAVIAGVLHRDALRGRDDASVVVVRDMRAGVA